MEQNILWLIVGIMAAQFVLDQVLTYLNTRNWSEQLPTELEGIIDAQKYRLSQQYSLDKTRFSAISDSITFLLTLTLLLIGGFGWLSDYVAQFTDSVILQTLMFFGILTLLTHLAGIPADLYANFVIEEKYGFNRMTARTFVLDLLKSLLLTALIGGGLLSLFVLCYELAREYFWFYAWALIMLISVLLAAFYTSVLLPLFNKLTPLPEGELLTAIRAYAEKVKFPLKKIMVMDGSKRSSKGNAFFSGIGGSKNIVFYDTLIEKHTTEELVAILAHEVGHYKRKHTLQTLVISALKNLFTFYLLHILIDNPALSLAMGGSQHTLYLGLLSFMLLYSPISTVTGLGMNIFSRKNEFEADRYAVETASGAALAEALRKLSVDSLVNLKPHPAYVFWNYSHPPLLSRLEGIYKAARG